MAVEYSARSLWPCVAFISLPRWFQRRGQRPEHVSLWKLPIPEFDPAKRTLARLAELGALAERLAQEVEVNPDSHFAASRRRIREHLVENPDAAEIDDLVYKLPS